MTKQKKFTWEFWAIPKIIMDDNRFSLQESVLLGILATRMNGLNHAFPTQKELSELLHVSIRSIQRYISHIENHGWITTNKKNTSRINSYQINIPPIGDNLSSCHECRVDTTSMSPQHDTAVSPSYMYKEQDKEQYSAAEPLLYKNKLKNAKNIQELKNIWDTIPTEVKVQIEEFKNKLKKKLKDLEPQSFEEYYKDAKNSDRRDLNIIAEYADEKKIQYTTHSQWQEFVKRNLRAAGQLKHYSDNQIGRAMTHMQENLKTVDNPKGFITKWTLETIIKHLDN